MKAKKNTAFLLFVVIFLLTGCVCLENKEIINNSKPFWDSVELYEDPTNDKECQIESFDSSEINSAFEISSVSHLPEELDEWLENNLWDILGNINLANTPEVCDLINPRSAQLYIADIDLDGSFELVHSLFTGTYTIINSVYKLNNGELIFYGYYYSGLYTSEKDFMDGVYTNSNKRRYFCSRYISSGGSEQPCLIQIYEINFDNGIDLTSVISTEWVPSLDGRYILNKAEYDGGVILDENEYNKWLSDFFNGYTQVGELVNIIDSLDVPFSIGFKDIISKEDEREIIDWICDRLYQ